MTRDIAILGSKFNDNKLISISFYLFFSKSEKFLFVYRSMARQHVIRKWKFLRFFFKNRKPSSKCACLRCMSTKATDNSFYSSRPNNHVTHICKRLSLARSTISGFVCHMECAEIIKHRPHESFSREGYFCGQKFVCWKTDMCVPSDLPANKFALHAAFIICREQNVNFSTRRPAHGKTLMMFFGDGKFPYEMSLRGRRNFA